MATYGSAVSATNPAVVDETVGAAKTTGGSSMGIGLRGADAAPLPGAMYPGNPIAPVVHFAANAPAPAPPAPTPPAH